MTSQPYTACGKSFKNNWDCSKVENVKEEEDEDWNDGDPIEVQWAEDDKLEDSGTKKSGCRFFAGRRPGVGST